MVVEIRYHPWYKYQEKHWNCWFGSSIELDNCNESRTVVNITILMNNLLLMLMMHFSNAIVKNI